MGNFNLTEKLKEELKKRNLWEQDDDEDDNDEEDDDETIMTMKRMTTTKKILNLPIITKISVIWLVKYYTLKNKLTFFI
jgi:hypothetical protein